MNFLLESFFFRPPTQKWVLPGLLVAGFLISLTLGAIIGAEEGERKATKADLNPDHFGVQIDANKVEGPMECAECHPNAFMAWKESTHGTSFKTRHRSKKAKKIAKKMGIRRFRAEDSLCTSCHTTMDMSKSGKKEMAIAGPSCESCHGESKKWLNDHFNFGGADMRKDETPAHRAKRLKMLSKKGMVAPDDLFGIAERCFACHVVSNASLVEVGGHPTGSRMNLAAWTQGEVRHNFVDSRGKKNAEAPIHHRREFYLAGIGLEAEWGLRQLMNAEEDGELAFEGMDRVDSATKSLKRLEKRLVKSAPKAKELLKKVRALIALLKPLDEDALMKLRGKADKLKAHADKVHAAAKSLSENFHASSKTISAFDSLLPKAENYQGKTWMPKAAKAKAVSKK